MNDTPTPTPPDFRALCAELHEALERRCESMEDERLLDRSAAALRAALEAQPELVGAVLGPSEDDVTELFYRHVGEGSEVGFENAIAEALARWGRPAIEPIPVSERLPGPEDCDAEGRCWLFHVGMDGIGDWHQRAPYPTAGSYQFFRITHWLPFHSLPTPRREENLYG